MSVQTNWKSQADAAYKRGNYEEAVELYTKALQQAPNDQRLWTNRAQTYFKLKRWNLIIDDCTEALRLDSLNLKALFRRGRAYQQLGNIQAARADLNHALTIDPTNQAVQEALIQLDQNKDVSTSAYQVLSNNCSVKKPKKTPIHIQEVDSLPSWAQNEQCCKGTLEHSSWNLDNQPTLYTLTQRLRNIDNTETSRRDRFMYFFSLDYTILPRLFGAAGLEGAFVETFLQAIEHAYYYEKDKTMWLKRSFGFIEQLSICPRFEIAILFVKKETLEHVDQLFQKEVIEEEYVQLYKTIWKLWMEKYKT